MADAPHLLTVAETAALLHIGRRKARQLAQTAGALWRVGGSARDLRVHWGRLSRYLDGGMSDPAPAPRRRLSPVAPTMTDDRPAPFEIDPYTCRAHRFSSKRRAWSWRARAYDQGRERTHCIPAMGAADARRRLLAIVAAEQAGRRAPVPTDPARLTLARVFDDHVAAIEARSDRAASTKRVVRCRGKVLRSLPVRGRPLGERLAMSLDEALLDDFTAARQVGPGTLRGDLAFIRSAMRRAVRRGHLRDWPEVEWPAIQYRPANPSRAPSDEAASAFFAAVDADARRRHHYVAHVLRLMAETGCRIMEVCSAASNDWRIDDADPVLIVRRGKTGARDVPMTAEAVRLVRDARARWTSPAGTLWPVQPRSARARCYKVAADLGLKIRPHSWRAAVAQQMADAGVPLHVAGAVLGNSAATLAKFYLGTSSRGRRAAMDARDNPVEPAALGGPAADPPEHSPEHSDSPPVSPRIDSTNGSAGSFTRIQP